MRENIFGRIRLSALKFFRQSFFRTRIEEGNFSYKFDNIFSALFFGPVTPNVDKCKAVQDGANLLDKDKTMGNLDVEIDKLTKDQDNLDHMDFPAIKNIYANYLTILAKEKLQEILMKYKKIPD